MDWAAELLRVGGLTAVPLALVVALWTRLPGTRPATRHAMWAAVVLSFVLPGIASLVWRPAWFQSSRVMAHADRALGSLEAGLSVNEASGAQPEEREPVAAAARGKVEVVERQPALREVASDLAAPLPAVAFHGVEVATPREEAAECGREVGGAVEMTRFGLPLAAVEPAVDMSVPWPASSPNIDAARGEREGASRGRTAPLPAASLPPPRVPPAPASAMPSRSVEEGVGEVIGGWGEEVRAWVAGALVVRDAIAALPALPLGVWGVGALVLLSVGAGRAWAVRRMVRAARPVGTETRELVELAAAELGLRRVPETLITGERVSPMVWCGRRARIVLPAGLWRELDGESRRAVLLHELAHVKRRDHWLCWLTAAVGVVYWWHPVAWWARKRVRDEADAACDAWVTSVMPASRRAYAEALVTAKWYVSCSGRRVPRGLAGCGGALGAVSGRTKHLARRLKMVMTQRVAPRSSLAGAMMALGVLAAGMVVMPGLACPPEEAAAQAHAKAAKEAERAAKSEAKAAAKARSQGKQKKALEEVEFFGEAPALEAMRRPVEVQGRPMSEEDMMREMDARMRRLEEQLQRLHQSGQQPGPRGSVGPGPMSGAVASEWMAARGSGGGAAATAPRRDAILVEGMPLGNSGGMATMAPRPGAVVVQGMPMPRSRAVAGVMIDGGDVAREYRLPEGKLEALTELMARQDVPVLIERHEDRIVVHAPESKQRIFAAFVSLIHPDGGAVDIIVEGQPLPGGQARLIERRALEASVRKLQVDRERAVQQMQRERNSVERQRRNAERQAERARERTERTEEEMEELRERIEQLHEEREESTDQPRSSRLDAEIQQLAAKLQAKGAEIGQLVQQALASEDVERRLEEAMETLEQRIEEMSEQLEEQIEQLMESMEEDAESSMEATTEEEEIEVPGVAAIAPLPPMPASLPAAAAPSAPPAPPAASALPAPPAPPAPPATPAPAAAPAAPSAAAGGR